MQRALCPGSFDPPTNGHIDVIERAARYFDGVVVAVIANPHKDAVFSLKERTDMLEEALAHLDNVTISSFDGLLFDFARAHDLEAAEDQREHERRHRDGEEKDTTPVALKAREQPTKIDVDVVGHGLTPLHARTPNRSRPLW
jgi:cytidyltransferase-like protein